MCTAVVKGDFIGRTLDYNRSFGESVVILPKGYSFKLKHEGEISAKNRIMGVCHRVGDVPLFYDGINECGVGICGLNFPGYAHYFKKREGKLNLASFEIMTYVLSLAESLDDAVSLLSNLNITNDFYAEGLPVTPMHWIIADTAGSAVVEPLESGIKITKNPVGVMTNAPAFDYHLTRLSEIVSLHPGVPEDRLFKSGEFKAYSRGMGAIGLPGDYSSVSRFLRAVYVKENIVTGDEGEALSLFHILNSVAVPWGCAIAESGEPVKTIYTSAANLREGKYYYSTYRNSSVKEVSFDEQKGSELFYKDFS